MSTKAEYGLIGSIVIDPSCLEAVREIITAEDLELEQSKLIYKACCRRSDAGEPFDEIILAGVPGIDNDYLHQLVEITPTAAYATSYAKTIKENSLRNCLAGVGVDLSDIDASTDFERAAADAIDRLEKILDRKDSGVIGNEDSLLQYFDWLQGRVDGSSRPCATGIKPLDDYLNGGYEDGSLNIIGARPGVGKSSVGLIIADAISASRPTLYVTMEMPVEQLNARRIANLSSVMISSALGRFDRDSAKHWDAINNAMLELQKRQLYFNTSPNCTLNDIRTQARKVKAKCIVIDYLGLITDRGKWNSQYEKVTYISGQLKKMALSMNIPIVAMCQLNRDASNGEPKLSDLRDSGAIEQDADTCMMLHRPQMTESPTPLWQELRMMLLKNRNGATGILSFDWCAQNGRIKHKSGYGSWHKI